MTEMELIMGVVIGMALILAIAVVATVITTKLDKRKFNKIQNVYLGKLENSDPSIKNAMQYIKLTNGLKQNK